MNELLKQIADTVSKILGINQKISQDLNTGIQKLDDTAKSEGKKTRSSIGLTNFLLLLIIGLIAYALFFASGCNKAKESVITGNCDNTVILKEPVDGAIVDPEAVKFSWFCGIPKSSKLPYAKFNPTDAERFEKIQQMATFQQRGYQVWVTINPSQFDTVDCKFFIQDWSVDSLQPKVVATTPIPNPAKIEVPKSRKNKNSDVEQETETSEVVEEKSEKGFICDSVLRANEMLRSKLAQAEEANSTLGNLANQKGAKTSELEEKLRAKDLELADAIKANADLAETVPYETPKSAGEVDIVLADKTVRKTINIQNGNEVLLSLKSDVVPVEKNVVSGDVVEFKGKIFKSKGLR